MDRGISRTERRMENALFKERQRRIQNMYNFLNDKPEVKPSNMLLEPIPLSKIRRYKGDFYKHTIPEDSWSILVQERWVRVSIDKVPLEVKGSLWGMLP